ncbi:uncharacterized protein LOC134814194 isoform X4 [Bolinopsis microptera]|uniref:uncharacterized protein LOC134814194 isoform X4 n=1 Tax=Bolinopsis microptera TaxID=2820187 RepID=UPI003079BBF2
MSKSEEDITDVLLENKLLFEQLNELKSSERQYLNERNAVEDLLADEFNHLKQVPYHEIVHHLIDKNYKRTTEYEKAIARAIEKEGEVITLKAKLNSVQQHCRIENQKLEAELKEFQDKAKHERDRQNLSTNDQIAHLIQERDSSQANELVLAERVGELMDEIVKLNDEVAKFKQEKIDMSLNRDTQHEEFQQLQRELLRITEEDEIMINNLQNELLKRNNRCVELEEEVSYLQKRSEVQRQELQSAGDSSGSQQVELFQYKAKIKDLHDQIGILNRQLGTLKENNSTLNDDNQILAEKFVVLSEKFSKKEEALRDLQRDYKYKLEEVEKLARVEKEKHDTVEAQYSEMRITLLTLQAQINKLRGEGNRALRGKAEYQTENEHLKEEIGMLKGDKQEMLRQMTNEDETLQTLLKKQDDQNKVREQQLASKIDELMEKIISKDNTIDEKEGEIKILEHHISQHQNMIKQLEERLLKAQETQLDCQKRAITSEKDAEITMQNIDEIRRELNENIVQLECYEEEITKSKESICTIEVFNGTEMKHLYTNISLPDNIEKLKHFVLESNQIISNNKRKIEAINTEIRSAHELSQQLKEKLYVAENETSSLTSQLTSAKTHLESSHKEIRQLRETILKGEKGKRVMERRIHSIEGALSEMQGFIQAAKVKNVDSSKAKEIYDNLHNAVKELLNSPDPTKQAIEVELVIDELNVLRDEIRQIQQQHITVVSERDSISKKLQHEQNWVDKLRQKEENLTRTLDDKNEQLSSVKHELQLRERLLSDKERAAQIKKGELEDEIKTLKKRHKTMMSGKNCGHEGLLTEVDQLRNHLQVARNTVQYKEQELVTLAKEKGTIEEKLNNSNTEKLHSEILQLNLENAKLQGQLSGATGEVEEVNHAEERSNLLGVINQNKVDFEEVNRKLYQSELRSETLVTAIDELKQQHEMERERYKRDLNDFHERVTTQKEQLSRNLKELEELKIKYLETKKQKELAEEEAIRLGERVKQFRDTNHLESNKIDRLEKEVDRKTESLTVLTEKSKAAEAKVHEQEIEISQLNRSVLALEQAKTTIQLKYSDLIQKYEREKDHFESVKQKLRARAKNYKLQYEKENSALINKSAVLEEETALLKLHVNKEETWRKTAEQTYAERRNRTRELETSCATFDEEVRMQKSELHALNCNLSARHDEIAALTAELQHATRAQQHYERMYRTLELKSRADTSRDQMAPGNITHPIMEDNVLTSTPIRPRSQSVEAPELRHEARDVIRGDATLGTTEGLHVEQRDDLSDKSGLTLEEEGLNLDDPSKPDEEREKLPGGIVEEPITLPPEPQAGPQTEPQPPSEKL